MKRFLTARNFRFFVVTCFAFACIYLVILLFAPHIEPPLGLFATDDFGHAVQLYFYLSAIFVLYWPEIFAKITRFKISDAMLAMYVSFIFLALVLGEILDFYTHFVYWDFFLHFISGIILGTLGFAILHNAQRNAKTKMGAGVTAVFAFAFSMAGGKIWEIYEFTIDSLLGINTQQWADAYGVPLVGQAALHNTMWDMIFNMIGAILVAVWGYKRIKREGWPKGLQITKK